MSTAIKWSAVAMLWLGVLAWPGTLPADDTTGQGDCMQIASMLKEENGKLSHELRRIQREIAALRADLDKPGLKDVFAGIGYILGLFGAAAFVAARRKE